ncbi:hypothetical protein OG21DRAFT_1489716 [Imleria badia]|nr:hypothetical protein OG21DRAFT_1489716 [Imleria badia]
MPNCPRCLKHFSNKRGVQFHLAQPRTACHDSNYQYSLEVPRLPGPPAEYFNSVDISPPLFPLPFDPLGLDPPFEAPLELPTLAADEHGVEVKDTRPFPEVRDPHSWDQYSELRKTNPYYPFASPKDWMEANFLSKSRLSMALIDKYLSMDMTKDLSLSFHTARDLRSCIEMLPSGPKWKYQVVSSGHQTKDPMHLYYRDPLECVKLLFNNPIFADKMEYAPYKLFTSAERDVRVYAEWMGSDGAWLLQEKIPVGATLCGIILSSDKTHITNICGGKVAHPLLISLANIKMHARSKAAAHGFLLLTLLPIPEFIHETARMRSVLEARLFHHCLDIVLEPLKQAMKRGVTMPDPLGELCYCFTPLISYIANTPEACVISCVQGKTSPVTMASYKNFGDSFQHPPRTAAITKHQLQSIEDLASLIEEYFAACEEFCLSGVSLPFWYNWLFASPSRFLTPEVLHHWHQIDFRFSVLLKITALRHFRNGITKLKQAILDAGLCRGEKTVLNHFQIPKLELMQSVVPSIAQAGCLLQWSADTTEHAHIEVVKEPASMTNHHDYDAQICRALDRDERCRLFNATICLQTTIGDHDNTINDDDEDEDTGEILPADVLRDIWTTKRQSTNFFEVTHKASSVIFPPHTIIAGSIAIHLNVEHIHCRRSIEEVAEQFGLPDLHAALADYVNRERRPSQKKFHRFGSARQSGPDADLPFSELQIWHKDQTWKFGRYDAAILQVDQDHQWPLSGLTGHPVVLSSMPIFLTEQLKCSEQYTTNILHAIMTINLIEVTVAEFHQRRHHLVDCLRYLFEAAALAQLLDAPRLYLRLKAFVRQDLVPASKPDTSLASHIFNETESIRTVVTRAQTARQNIQSKTIPPSRPGSRPSLSDDILNAHYDSLKYKQWYLSISINWLTANPNDTTTSYILTATLATFNSAEPHSFPGKVCKTLATDKGTIAYMKQQLAPNTHWKEPGLKATILLKWTLFMAETRHCDPTLENQQGFKMGELESQIWDAVQGDAFTYLATALIQFHKRTHTSPVSSLTQFVQLVPEQQQKEPLAEEFQLPVLNMCDVLVRSLLTYASSELHKTKQRQEDLLTSVRTDQSRIFRAVAPASSEIEGQPAPRNDIPMLYSLIGVLYASLPPERALQFWGATPTGKMRGLSYMELMEMSAGKLLSFLQWAVWSTQVRDVDMTMALYDMLSGLAKGQQCSELTYNFLARGGGEVIPGSSLPSSTGSYNAGPSISWSTIFALLESWTSPAPNPCTNQPPSLAALFGRFGSLPTSQPHPPTQQPPQHIPIGPKDILLTQSFLRLLSTVATSSIAMRLAISSNTQFRAIPTLDEVEAVYKLYPTTIPFLNLLAMLLHMPKRLSPRLLADVEPLNTIPESLGQPYRLPGIRPYVSFMVDNFVECALAGWEIENLVRASEDMLTRLLTNSPLQSTILSYIVNGIEGFEHELPSEEPCFLLTIIRVLRIIHQVLEIRDIFLDVLVPILSEFDSAPFVGTVHSRSFYTWFNQALTYGTKYIPPIISQLSCSTSVTSLLTLIEHSPDSERILGGFRQLLDVDSLDDVNTAETTTEHSTGAGAADRETQEPLDQAIRIAILDLLIRNTERETTYPNFGHFLLFSGAESEHQIHDPHAISAHRMCTHVVLDLVNVGIPQMRTKGKDAE